VTDMTLATLGGALKRREKISGRLADALAWMYLASAALKRFHDDGRPAADLPLLRWSCDHALWKVKQALVGVLHNLPYRTADLALLRWSCDLALWKVQQALVGVLDNLPNRPAAMALRVLIFPLGARQRPPRDALASLAARGLLDGDDMRQRLTQDIFIPDAAEEGLGRLETALGLVVATREIQKKIRDAVRHGSLDAEPAATLTERALTLGIINADERQRMDMALQAQDAAIQV